MKQLLMPLLMLVGGVAFAATAPRVTIELRPEVRTAAATVTLGQLARLESNDLGLLRRLVDLPLGRGPAAGDSALLERDALAGWLRSRAGLQHEQVAWRGPATSRVLPASRIVAGEEVAAAATATLREWLRARDSSAAVDLVATPRDLVTTEGELRLHPRDLAHAQLRSRMTVWVEVWIGARFQRVVPVTCTVTMPDVDATAFARPAPADPQRPRDAKPLLAVARGEWAALQSREGGVSTEARVQVLQDGQVGDKVRVRASAAPLLVRVTGPGQLEVAR